jgi:predicted DNA-binding transcriptional regulator YafY
MMKNGRYPNCKRLIEYMKDLDIAHAYNISQKTVQRDIQYLKDEYDAPIRYNSNEKGYYLTNPDWSCYAPMLSDEEMRAVIIGARLAEKLMPQPVSGEIMRSAGSLIFANAKGLDETACLLSLVATGSRVPVKSEIFKVVFSAWQSHHALEISYRNAGNGTVSKMFIEPHVLVFHDGLWYLKVICLKTNGRENKTRFILTLAVHRIEAVATHPGTFEPDMELIRTVNTGKVFDFPTIPEVKLRFSGNAIRFAQEYYPEKAIEKNADGSLLVTLKDVVDFKIINLVLNENGAVQVISPPELIARVIEQAEKVIRLQKEIAPLAE